MVVVFGSGDNGGSGEPWSCFGVLWWEGSMLMALF